MIGKASDKGIDQVRLSAYPIKFAPSQSLFNLAIGRVNLVPPLPDRSSIPVFCASKKMTRRE